MTATSQVDQSVGIAADDLVVTVHESPPRLNAAMWAARPAVSSSVSRITL